MSRTFHGRDVFSPAAAHLASGVDPAELGPPLHVEMLVRLDLPEPDVSRGRVRATVVDVDRFGNVQLNLRREHLETAGIEPGRQVELELALDRYYAVAARTFADARRGDIVLYEDSYRNVAIAINGGNASRDVRREARPRAEDPSGAVSELRESLGRRFARFATDVVVRRPALWRVFRRPMERQFDSLAPVWETRIMPHHVHALEQALADVPAPKRALDVGSGTGVATFAVARRFPEAEVVGIDLSPQMVEQARAKTPPELAERVRFQVGDASALPLEDGSFDLVTLMNAIPFFAELARVTSRDARVVASYSRGADTPIYVPDARYVSELEPRGFTHFASFTVEPATAFLAARAVQT